MQSRQLCISGNAKAIAAKDDSEKAFLSNQLITYIGNKRSLLNFIGEGVSEVLKRRCVDKLSCYDVFAGSGAVSRFLKQFSNKLYVNDLEKYSEVINKCYLANPSEVDINELSTRIATINQQANKYPSPGFISELYSPANDHCIQPGERTFYTNRNATFIDTSRQLIDQYDDKVADYFLLAPLVYVASVHANTSGVFKGFYKNSKTGIGQFGGIGQDALSRIIKPFNLPMPIFSNNECEVQVLRGDASKISKSIPEVDLAYIDPPYNQHPYGSNYFMLNLIVDYKRPTNISQISGIPPDWNRSLYNKRPLALPTFQNMLESIKAKFLLVSSNSEGFISNQQMLEMLRGVGRVEALEKKYNTFRGSRNIRNRDIYVTEFLYLVERH